MTKIIEVESKEAPCGWFAYRDALDRSDQSYKKHQAFFDNVDHQARVALVEKIVNDFFKVKKGIYINCRSGTKATGPWTAVKINHPQFPNHLSPAKKDEMFYKPLKDIGAVIRHTPATNSYTIEVY